MFLGGGVGYISWRRGWVCFWEEALGMFLGGGVGYVSGVGVGYVSGGGVGYVSWRNGWVCFWEEGNSM